MQFIQRLLGRNVKPFTEAPERNSVSEDYFFRMMSPEATKLSKKYDLEEQQVLENLLSTIPKLDQRNFIVVGAGPLWYIELSLPKVKYYIAIEPLSNLFIQKQFHFLTKQFPNIKIINKKFQDVEESDIPSGNSLYVFIFNILAYMENPIDHINKLIKKGDILYISTWNKTDEAKKTRKKYFGYLNSFEDHAIIDPEQTIGLCNLDIFPFEQLKYYERHERIKGAITDVLIIYT